MGQFVMFNVDIKIDFLTVWFNLVLQLHLYLSVNIMTFCEQSLARGKLLPEHAS